uniref:Uncharacterized protein n=1 Tax=Thiocapsa roseopersicina TaxID=1058 RepID=Q7X3H3_THIRO|nr:hypothetical protein [Thiocapsa roseopersicina]
MSSRVLCVETAVRAPMRVAPLPVAARRSGVVSVRRAPALSLARGASITSRSRASFAALTALDPLVAPPNESGHRQFSRFGLTGFSG